MPGSILKVDGLISHQRLPKLTDELKPNKVLTIEVSGITPALITAIELGAADGLARKKKPITIKRSAEFVRG